MFGLTGLNIIYPLTPALMTTIGLVCFFATKQLKKEIPQGPNQNLIVRGICVGIGVAMAVLSLPLTPGFVYSYNSLIGALIQGGAAGAGVTAAVWAVYAATSTPATPAAPASK